MKIKINKEDYYKLKCEEWFNDRSLIVYGMFATYKEYIPITFESISTKIRTRITNIESWQELYERKLEVLHIVLMSSSISSKEEKPIQELKNKRFTRNQKQIAGKMNELIRAINKLKNKE